MGLAGRRWPVAVASGILCAAWPGAAFADPFFNPIDAVDRPLTLPAHELGVATGGFAVHPETGPVFVGSNLGASYGVTNRLEVQLSALNVEYTPVTRLLGPGGAVTYAIPDHAARRSGCDSASAV